MRRSIEKVRRSSNYAHLRIVSVMNEIKSKPFYCWLVVPYSLKEVACDTHCLFLFVMSVSTSCLSHA